MIKSCLTTLIALSLFGCSSASPPSEEECAPLKVAWEEQEALDRIAWKKSVRDDIEAEVRRTVGSPGPKIGERERKALARAATNGGKAKVNSPDEPLIEEHPAPKNLTRTDREALADDPATKVRAPEPAPIEVAEPPTTFAPKAPAPTDTTKRILEVGSDTLRLKDLVVALGVENRQPVSPGSNFQAGPQQFFCYAVYDSTQADQKSTHVWRYKQKVLSRVELNVGKSPSWRTWSRHRTRPNATGDWSCEVLDAHGKQLGKAHFTVGKTQ